MFLYKCYCPGPNEMLFLILLFNVNLVRWMCRMQKEIVNSSAGFCIAFFVDANHVVCLCLIDIYIYVLFSKARFLHWLQYILKMFFLSSESNLEICNSRFECAALHVSFSFFAKMIWWTHLDQISVRSFCNWIRMHYFLFAWTYFLQSVMLHCKELLFH